MAGSIATWSNPLPSAVDTNLNTIFNSLTAWLQTPTFLNVTTLNSGLLVSAGMTTLDGGLTVAGGSHTTGGTTTDTLTISTSGTVAGKPILATSNAGFIMIRSQVVVTTASTGLASITYAAGAFPTSTDSALVGLADDGATDVVLSLKNASTTASGIQIHAVLSTTNAAFVGTIRLNYLAMGH